MEAGQNPAMTQQELTSSASPLSESAFRPDGTFPVRIISEGWGSSGFYSKKVLSEAAGLYKKGTKMFLNHPTRTEMKERPERDVTHVAAYFVKESAWWDDNGVYGPGLYQEAKALPNYAEWLKEAAPVLGVSHYVLGRIKQGESGGRTGPIVESIDQVQSVDFVTIPGRGGSIGAMYESWKGLEAQYKSSNSLSARMELVRSAIREKYTNSGGDIYVYVSEIFDDFAIVEISDRKVVVPYSIDKTGESPKVNLGDAQEVEQIYQTKESAKMPDEPEVKTVLKESWDEMREQHKLTESKNHELMKENDSLKTKIAAIEAENTNLKESLAKETEKNIFAEAAGYASELIEKSDVPELAKDRIKTAAVQNAKMIEGKLDKDALKAFVESEITYAKSLTGSRGTVKGMGSTNPEPATVTMEESKKALLESYMASGMSEETARQIIERF